MHGMPEQAPAAHLDEAPVAVAGVAGGDALADDARACVLADVQHLGAGVGLRSAEAMSAHLADCRLWHHNDCNNAQLRTMSASFPDC